MILLYFFISVIISVFGACIIKWLIPSIHTKPVKYVVINICISFILPVVLFGGISVLMQYSVFKLLTFLGIAVCSNIISIIILFLASSENKKTVCLIALALLICILLESTLFNMNYYKSYDYVPQTVSGSLSEDQLILSKDNNTLSFTGVNEHIDNIYIKLTNTGKLFSVGATVRFTDAANELLKTTPERIVHNYTKQGQYINTNFSGDTHSFQIVFDISDNSVVMVDEVVINANRPFDFNLLRFLIMFAAAVIICLIIRHRKGFGKKLIDNKGAAFKAAVFCFAGLSTIIIILASLNPVFINIYTSSDPDSNALFELGPFPVENHNLYDKLAQSFLDGHLYLEEEPPEALVNMENPYDASYRVYVMQTEGASYLWDAAYYNGHYYVYFGVVPVLLLYLPFRALTACPFPTHIGIIVFDILCVLGIFMLFRRIAEKYFKQTTIGMYLLTTVTLISCCGLMFIAKRPDYYLLAILMGLTFSVWGLYNWLGAISEDNKHRKRNLIVGSLFMALVAGCRPQLLLLSLLALPIFWGRYIKDKKLFSKKGVSEIIAAAIPFIVVAAGLMAYNYLRFGSPFDFGATYNLTTNDMTNRGFNISRIGLTVFTFFFQTPNFQAKFPYLNAVVFSTNYVGTTIYEYCFGGLFACYPFLWILLLIRRAKDVLESKKLYKPAIVLIFIGLIISIMDAQMAGILQRYFSDFSIMIFSAAILVIYALEEKLDKLGQNNIKKVLNGFVGITFAAGLIYTFCLVFSVSDVTINRVNPEAFYTISDMVEFWL